MGHKPVQVEVVVNHLVWDPNGLYVDGTVGCGNHAREILDRLSSEGRLWGFDWDREMLEVARMKLSAGTDRVRLFDEPFSRIGTHLKAVGCQAQGIFLDLGLNSVVLDSKERGFRYRDSDAPLDMRMDRRRATTAADLLRTASEDELFEIFRTLGEVRRPRAVARAIVRAREERAIETAGDLVLALRRGRALGGGAAELSRIHQSLRYVVNAELDELAQFVDRVPDWIVDGGRLLVLSYESLSDRMVKSLHRKRVEAAAPFRLLTGHVVKPDREEIRTNPRARSAKLRIMERTA